MLNPTNSPLSIRYRKGGLSPDFDSEEEEYEATRDFIQGMMQETTRESVMDSILMLINICEMRANMIYGAPSAENWHVDTARVLRAALSVVSHMPNSVGPDERLENPNLYWPDMESH